MSKRNFPKFGPQFGRQPDPQFGRQPDPKLGAQPKPKSDYTLNSQPNSPHKTGRDHRPEPNGRRLSSRLGPFLLPYATLPTQPITTDELLEMLGVSPQLRESALQMVVICDNDAQSKATLEQIIRANRYYVDRNPAVVSAHAIAHRVFTIAEIQKLAVEGYTDPEVVGLSLLVLFCRVEPTELVLGIGEQGQGVVADLKAEAAKMYPDRVECFMTQADAEQEAKTRPFADDPDAFMLVALEHLLGIKIGPDSTATA